MRNTCNRIVYARLSARVHALLTLLLQDTARKWQRYSAYICLSVAWHFTWFYCRPFIRRFSRFTIQEDVDVITVHPLSPSNRFGASIKITQRRNRMYWLVPRSPLNCSKHTAMQIALIRRVNARQIALSSISAGRLSADRYEYALASTQVCLVQRQSSYANMFFLYFVFINRNLFACEGGILSVKSFIESFTFYNVALYPTSENSASCLIPYVWFLVQCFLFK